MIRDATDADIPAIRALWNQAIRDTLITFTSVEKTAGDIAATLAAKRAAGHAFLVAEEAGRVLGYASFGQFRAGDGYAHAFEHSILLVPEAWGRGLGRALMTALEGAARQAGGHVMIAGVSAANPAGVAFHAAIGFTEIARLPEVGTKFGAWRDLILMLKRL
jgi:phosphinothricin acetyltransferase